MGVNVLSEDHGGDDDNDDCRLWIVMEYLDGGSLRLVVYYTKLHENQISLITGQCLQALSFLHDMNIIHRSDFNCNLMLIHMLLSL